MINWTKNHAGNYKAQVGGYNWIAMSIEGRANTWHLFMEDAEDGLIWSQTYHSFADLKFDLQESAK